MQTTHGYTVQYTVPCTFRVTGNFDLDPWLQFEVQFGLTVKTG